MPDTECGLRRIRMPKVAYGHDTVLGAYPWQARVKVPCNATHTFSCGGVLVSRQHIVTAAHCMNGSLPCTASYLKPIDVEVLLGIVDLRLKPESLRNVSKIFFHPQYRRDHYGTRYDVAVLKLDKPVQYADHIVPICLPVKNDFVSEGTEAMVSGWGRRDPNIPKSSSNILQAVDVNVIGTDQCQRWHRNWHGNSKIQPPFTLYDDRICAGQGKEGACRGDSGGPLMTKKDDRWTLIGLVSWGIKNSCNKAKLPTVYHQVAATIDWIYSHLI